MRYAPVVVCAVVAIPAVVLWAQPGTGGRHRSLEERVASLETRVARLERVVRRADPPTVTGDLDGLPREVLDAVAWAHPGALITDTDRDEDLDGRVTWEIELTARTIDWVMLIRPDGQVLDDRVAD